MSAYFTLLFIHSWWRWMVLASLVGGIIRAVVGLMSGRRFSAADNSWRHWTATIAHVQLLIGTVLYVQSPLTKYFMRHAGQAIKQPELRFFGFIHLLLMLASVVLVTIGSSMAKRKTSDRDKFRTMLIWFLVALLVICIAIPWPFSPFAKRMFFRSL